MAYKHGTYQTEVASDINLLALLILKIKKGGDGLFATFHPDVILNPYPMPKP